MKPTYLHEPITTAKQVEAILKDRKFEDEHHDWKAKWSAKSTKAATAHEAVKDVASFLNADGGSILLGITEDNATSAALGLFSDFELRGAREQLLDSLRDWLLPVDAAAYVGVSEFPTVAFGGVTGSAMAINVAPWPHGPVAVRDGDHRDRFRVPYRRGRETREMSWEEMMRRTDAGHRAMYLRLRSLIGDWEPGQVNLVIASPFETYIRKSRVRVNLPTTSWHGCVQMLDSELLELSLTIQKPLASAALREFRFPHGTRPNSPKDRETYFYVPLGIDSRETADHPPRSLRIPLDLVRSAWPERDGLALFLDAVVQWEPPSSELPSRLSLTAL